MLEAVRPVFIEPFCDARGALWKAVTRGDLGQRKDFGEIYVIQTKAGASRGNHYHERITEWFMALKGEVLCRMAVPGTSERSEVRLSGEKPALLKMPPGVAHSLVSMDRNPSLVLAYADKPYDPEEPDAVPFSFD